MMIVVNVISSWHHVDSNWLPTSPMVILNARATRLSTICKSCNYRRKQPLRDLSTVHRVHLRQPWSGTASASRQIATVPRWTAFGDPRKHMSLPMNQLRPGLHAVSSPYAFRTKVHQPAYRQRASTIKTAAAEQGTSSGKDEGRYPERNAVTGGWAGGEKGLMKFIEEFEEKPSDERKERVKKAAKKDPDVVSVNFKGKEVEARRREGAGSDAIYIGKRKGRAMLIGLVNWSSVGVLIRGPIGDADEVYIVDDDRKYPQKEDMGGFAGVVGGFAGGERGVKQFVEKGEVSLSEATREQGSPLVFAILIAVVGTAGGILITNVTEAGESALTAVEGGQLGSEVNNLRVAGLSLFNSSAQIDDNTKILIEVGLFVAGVLTTLTLGRSAVDGLTTNVRTGFLKATTLVLFFTVVGIALKFVIEN